MNRLNRLKDMVPQWSAERWIALLALAVSTIALLISINANYQDLFHKRLSIMPKINITFVYNDDGAGWLMGNQGLGPAVVKWFGVSVDGAAQRNWEAVARLTAVSGMRFSTPFAGTLIPAGQGGVLFWVKPGPDKQTLVKDFERVRIEMCFCSLYGECWLTTNTVRQVLGEPCSAATIKEPNLFMERLPSEQR